MKIIVTDPSLAKHRELFEATVPEGSVVSWFDGPSGVDERTLAETDVIVGSKISADMAAQASQLSLIHAAGAGTDGIESGALREDVVVCNTFHHEGSIAEHIVSTAIALRRNTIAQDAALRASTWLSPVFDTSIPQPRTLRGSVVTFLGFGHIGQATWNLLRAFGVKGIAITRTGSADADAHGLLRAGRLADLEGALAESDLLVVSIPLTGETEGLIRSHHLAALGTQGLLVNVARGAVVQEQALYEALSGGVIAGAALDVWYRGADATGHGAPSTLPFHELTNVIMTPHSSGVTEETFRERARDIATNIGRLQRGEALENIVSGS